MREINWKSEETQEIINAATNFEIRCELDYIVSRVYARHIKSDKDCPVCESDVLNAFENLDLVNFLKIDMSDLVHSYFDDERHIDDFEKAIEAWMYNFVKHESRLHQTFSVKDEHCNLFLACLHALMYDGYIAHHREEDGKIIWDVELKLRNKRDLYAVTDIVNHLMEM